MVDQDAVVVDKDAVVVDQDAVVVDQEAVVVDQDVVEQSYINCNYIIVSRLFCNYN